MAQIKINNIVYGTTNATEVIYNNTTVADKLDEMIILDVEDNEDINNNDYLTYGHIIDNVITNSTNKVLSTNQGKILDKKINILSQSIDNNIENLTNDITAINSKIEEINRVCIGSQVLCPSISGSGVQGKTPFMGAYYDSLIKGIFNGITIPSGWHKEFRITYQATNGGSGIVRVYLNNIQCGNGIGTWSGSTFRMLEGSNFFRDSDIIQVPTYNYSVKGMNLYYESATADGWIIYNITLHGYLVKDD